MAARSRTFRIIYFIVAIGVVAVAAGREMRSQGWTGVEEFAENVLLACGCGAACGAGISWARFGHQTVQRETPIALSIAIGFGAIAAAWYLWGPHIGFYIKSGFIDIALLIAIAGGIIGTLRRR